MTNTSHPLNVSATAANAGRGERKPCGGQAAAWRTVGVARGPSGNAGHH
jgi:hypothetical protein